MVKSCDLITIYSIDYYLLLLLAHVGDYGKTYQQEILIGGK